MPDEFNMDRDLTWNGPPNPSDIQTQVQKILSQTPYACASLEKLSGGSANYVYRGILQNPLEDGAKTIVIKHTEGYVASSPNFKLSRLRGHYENTILTSLQSLPPISTPLLSISTPKIYPLPSTTNTQIFSDLPLSTDLKTYCLTHALTTPQATHIGHSLGLWLKSFHVWGADPAQKELREKIKESTEMRALKYQINYPTMIATIENFPDLLEGSRAVFEDVAKDIKARLDANEGELIHGDFWTGNIVLPNTPFQDTPSTPTPIYIVDWELTCLSLPFFDVGQMCAELYELKLFKNIDAGLTLISSFISGYGPVSRGFAFDVVIFVGNHLLCWGTRVAGWGTPEQIREVVVVGREMVVKGWEKDERFFGEGPWGSWFS